MHKCNINLINFTERNGIKVFFIFAGTRGLDLTVRKMLGIILTIQLIKI